MVMLRIPKQLRSTYIRQRLITALIVFLVVYVLNFLIPRLEPGNFITALSDQSDLLPQQREQLIAMFGLNQPLWAQFILYLKQTFMSFPPSFGVSFSYYPLSVWTVVMEYLPWTLLLIIVSQGIAWPLGLLLGAVLAWRRGSLLDSAVMGVSTFMWGVPSYWLATLLIFVFAVKLHFFPAALTGNIVSGNPLLNISTILRHSFLPILTLVILNLPLHALVMRNTMVNIRQEDFVTAAEARGLKRTTLLFGHAARNAMLPSITNIALSFGTILSGAYLVEIVYSYPGMGYLITQAVFARDYPVLQGVFFFSALLVIFANIIGDVAYAFLDPRIEY
jgi:peptide/nickel transport system permease protein